MRARRKRTRSASASHNTVSVPRSVRIPYEPLRIFSEDEINRIHLTSLEVLRDVGMNFQLPEAVDILRREGADVGTDGKRVRFDPDFILERISTAPSKFTLHAREAKRTVDVGGSAIVFATVGSPPNVSDIDEGRRSGTFKDFCDLLRLAQSIDVVQAIAGYPVEPVDVDVSIRHLRCVAAQYELTSKPAFGYALGRQRMEDAIEIARLANGLSETELLEKPVIHTVVNANSPLIYDGPMLEGAIAMAKRNQPVIFTPFTLAGAMAPITIPGALVQQNAEALAGVAFSQCVNPGTPAVYGSFTSNVDMKSGSPAFGTPEYVKATIASGQLARKYGLPLRASNATASNAPDVQAAYESQMSLWACVLGHINYVNHGLGWLEGGLCASYEKMIIDAEMIQMLISFFKQETVDDESLALSAIAAVGPGNHYFQSDHTMSRYETAFYKPMLSDWRNFENWRDDGAVETTKRANRMWKKILSEAETPTMEEDRAEAISEFVKKRESEGGAPPL